MLTDLRFGLSKHGLSKHVACGKVTKKREITDSTKSCVVLGLGFKFYDLRVALTRGKKIETSSQADYQSVGKSQSPGLFIVSQSKYPGFV